MKITNESNQIKKISETMLLLIDAQEKIINPIFEKDKITKNIGNLLKVCEIFGIKIFLSEQNPTKLGKTIDLLIPKSNYRTVEKMDFSICNSKNLLDSLISQGIKNIIICGFETHICIQQSVLDLLDKNYCTYIIVDAMGSRKVFDHEIAIQRMTSKGATIASTESIIYELCQTSLRNEFRDINNLIKNN